MKLSSYSLEFLTLYSSEANSRFTQELAKTILAKVKFSSRNEALQNKTKTSRNILPFITTLAPVITESNRLGQICSEPAIAPYRKDKSLKDLLVRAKIPSQI